MKRQSLENPAQQLPRLNLDFKKEPQVDQLAKDKNLKNKAKFYGKNSDIAFHLRNRSLDGIMNFQLEKASDAQTMHLHPLKREWTGHTDLIDEYASSKHSLAPYMNQSQEFSRANGKQLESMDQDSKILKTTN